MLFSGSTHRWTILLTNVEVTDKRLSETMECHYEGVKHVFKCFKEIVDATEKPCAASKRSKPEEQLKLCCLQCAISILSSFFKHGAWLRLFLLSHKVVFTPTPRNMRFN
ncbi:hypothetical protein CDAR_540701 [Caerostris darwini]|uniref:Uncharacterized protein n=1 Tax=Caerostris darwini TaxID=1538125 RepID=A0AAV4VLM7_9ARAC|nr:hypothetical protein CDAR_540701 [Caerostris darwini]